MLNPLKFLFGSIINWVILLAIVGAGYLAYINYEAAQYSPEGVAKSFVELIQNPTDIISSEEKKTLGNITDSNIISSQKYQGYVKVFREINQSSPLEIVSIEDQGDTYHEALLEFKDPAATGENTKVSLFIEQYGEWYTGIKHRIFHLELINVDADENGIIKDQLIDTFDSVKESIGENFNDLRDEYGKDLLDLILPIAEQPDNSGNDEN